MQKTICSIFFQSLKTTRPFARSTNGGYNTTFEIPAAVPGEFKTLVVDDCHELQRNGSQQKFQTPVFGDAIAKDLVDEWRNNKIANEHGRPGVFICAGTEPTKAELDRERTIQTVWCVKLCNEAEGFWVNGKRDFISALHREAALWLGRGAYEWLHNEGQITLVACPFCASKVDSAAVICKECNNPLNLDKWLQHQSRMIEAEAQIAEMRKKAGLMPATPEPQAKPVPAMQPPLRPNQPKQPTAA
jgi:hypothetical protein